MNRKLNTIFAAVLLFALAGSAAAGTTGTEFQTLFQWVHDEVTGYLGRTIALAAGIGALLSIATVNALPILAGAGLAVFLQYTPSIVTGSRTATS